MKNKIIYAKLYKIAIGIAGVALVAGGVFGIHKLVTGYYFTSIQDVGTIGTLDYDLSYLNYVGDDKQPIKDAFETWQNEKMNTFYTNTNENQGYTALDGSNTEMSSTISYERADSKILCVIYSEYTYLGAGHGYYYSDGVNFDVETGKVLTVNDLGEAKESLKEMTLQKISEEYSAELTSGWQTTVEAVFADNSLDFRMGYDGINVVFDTYELGSYAMGPASVTIPYSDIKGLNPDYLPEEVVACLDIGIKN